MPLSRAPRLPSFPLGALPSWVRDEVAAVAHATQTDPAMAGAAALGCLAAAAGGRAVLEVRPGWREPLNLFLAAAAAPGTRKSATFRALTAPLVDAERRLVDEHRPRAQEDAVAREVADAAADAAKRAAGRAQPSERDALTADAVAAASFAAGITVPPMPRLLADDATPEVLASLLAEHGGRQAVVSPEGVVFDLLAGRYSARPNFDVALKAHAGDPLRVDRRGRTEYVESPALTIAVAVQPAVLDDIAQVAEFAGRGLLARFLYVLCRDNVGFRAVGADAVPDVTAKDWADRLISLVLDLHGWTDPAVLRLSHDAAALFLAAETAHEPALRAGTGALGGSQLTIEWGSKLMGAVGRLAGLLHLAEHGPSGIEMAARTPVSADTMRAALELGDYFASSALVVFDRMGADPTMHAARTVLSHLQQRGREEFSLRDLFSELPRSRFPKVDAVRTALGVLEEHGWVELLEPPEHSGPGRRPSPRYRLHPAAEHAQSAEARPWSLSADTADTAAGSETAP